MSEPKIHSHHENGKAGCPCLSPLSYTGIQVPSSRYFLEKGRGTIGHLFLPSSLERKRALGEKRRVPLKTLNLNKDYLGIRTVKLLAFYPGMLISHPGQGVKYKARGKMKPELSVLGWLHPKACPPQHHSRACLLWGMHFPCLQALWPASLLS